jgi:hypothetical protein
MATAPKLAFEYIVKEPGYCGGKAAIGRTRVRVNNAVEAIGDGWYRAGRAFPGVVVWRRTVHDRMSYRELVEVFESLARQDDPFSTYPILRICPSR